MQVPTVYAVESVLLHTAEPSCFGELVSADTCEQRVHHKSREGQGVGKLRHTDSTNRARRWMKGESRRSEIESWTDFLKQFCCGLFVR